MLRAALANLLFNLISAMLAFPLIDVLAPLLYNAVCGIGAGRCCANMLA